MKKNFLKSLIMIGASLSALYGMDKKEYLIDHGFIEKDKEDKSINISSELNVLPTPTGPYQIGVKNYDLVDENRENRLIPIWIFFPVEKKEQISSPKLVEKRALDTFDVLDVWEKLNIKAYSKLLENLDFLKNGSKHPVVFFNNGNGMLCTDNGFILEELASHGYIVVSIQNQLNTDKLESLKFSKGLENTNLVIRNNLFLFDWMKKNNSTIFYDSLDLSRIGVMGYSMGANSLLLWADKVSRDSAKTHFLFPHENANVKECIVSLDARRIAFPLINKTPLFMLISEERQEEQKLNGECDLMQKIGHQFKYYKNTHHGSFSDLCYLNIVTPISPKKGWYYGSTEKRMEFFNDMRKDILDFLDKNLKDENFLKSLQRNILEKNVDKLQTFAKNESLLASLMLIHMYTEGIGIEKNINEAEKWMLKVSKQMNRFIDQGQLELIKGESNLLKEIIQSNQIDSRDLSVYKGIMGYLYLRGWGVEKDFDLAFRNLKESADLGNVLSNVDLGKMYQEGLGTEKDLFEAYHRYRFAIDNELSIAYYRLGMMYEKGIGVEKNSKKAKELFQQADSFIQKHDDFPKIGGKIHFEEKSSIDYLGTLDLNLLTRDVLKEHFIIKDDSCAPNAKALIKQDNGDYFIKHYEERSVPGLGEEMHATLLYTSKRVESGHETLKDIYQNLVEVNKNLSIDRTPTVEEIAQAYHAIIKSDWKFEISDVEYIIGKTGSCIIAKLLYQGKGEILNEKGKAISGNFLHLTLVNVDLSVSSETEKINLVVAKLKEKLIGKKIKIGDRGGLADLEFGVSGSKDRIRPNSK